MKKKYCIGFVLVMCMVFTAGPLHAAPCDSLIALFPFDADLNSTVGGITGTAFGSPAVVTTPAAEVKVGAGALKLDGSTALEDMDGVIVSDPLDPGTGSWTFVAWVRRDGDNLAVGADATRQHILSKGSAINFYFQSRQLRTFMAVASPGGGHLSISGGNVTDGEWVHVALVIDRTANMVTQYLNGVPSGAPAAIDPAKNVTAANFSLGFQNASGGIRSLNGGLDDAAVFNAALSQAEIQDIMANGISIAGTTTETAGSTEVDEELTTIDTFDVVLSDGPPIADVTVDLVKEPNGVADFTLDTATLTFTNGNWNVPQIVTVQAVEDGVIEGTEVWSVSFSLTSSDPNFDGTCIEPISVVVFDNDQGDVAISETGGSTDISEEGATSDDYTLVLTVQPILDVTIVLGTDASQASLSTNLITFTNSNWNVPVTVTVTAIDDLDAEVDPHSVAITHALSSSDTSYNNGVTVSDVTVNISDNDCGAGPFLDSDTTGPSGTPDCVTDVLDFAAFAAEWMVCTTPNVPGCI